MSLEVTAIVTDEASVVEIWADPRGYDKVRVTGYAKKHPNDQPDSQLAYNLAMSRALQNLADEFYELADHDIHYGNSAAQRLLTDTFMGSGHITFSHDPADTSDTPF